MDALGVVAVGGSGGVIATIIVIVWTRIRKAAHAAADAAIDSLSDSGAEILKELSVGDGTSLKDTTLRIEQKIDGLKNE